MRSQIDNEIQADNIHIGPSDHVPWLTDRKWAYIRLEGTSFGDVPLNVETQAGSVGQSQLGRGGHRCDPVARRSRGDRGIGGPILAPSAYFMKSPPVQYHDDVAREMVEDFIAGRDGTE